VSATTLLTCSNTRCVPVWRTLLYRLCTRQGFDLESGFLQFRNMLVYDMDVSPIEKLQAAVADDTPLSVTYSEKNGQAVAGATASHRDVLGKDGSWGIVASILKKEYVEV
jgi:hypothetical protein